MARSCNNMRLRSLKSTTSTCFAPLSPLLVITGPINAFLAIQLVVSPTNNRSLSSVESLYFAGCVGALNERALSPWDCGGSNSRQHPLSLPPTPPPPPPITPSHLDSVFFQVFGKGWWGGGVQCLGTVTTKISGLISLKGTVIFASDVTEWRVRGWNTRLPYGRPGFGSSAAHHTIFRWDWGLQPAYPLSARTAALELSAARKLCSGRHAYLA